MDLPQQAWDRIPCPRTRAQHPIKGHPLFRQSIVMLFCSLANPPNPSGSIPKATFWGIIALCYRILDFDSKEAESEADDAVFSFPQKIKYSLVYDWAAKISQHWVEGADPFEHSMFLLLLFHLALHSAQSVSWAQAPVPQDLELEVVQEDQPRNDQREKVRWACPGGVTVIVMGHPSCR